MSDKIWNKAPGVNPRAYLNADQGASAFGVNDHVEWLPATSNSSAISVSTGAGQLKGIVTLAAGNTYRIAIGLELNFDSPAGDVRVSVFDRTQAAVLVADGSIANPSMLFVGQGSAITQAGIAVTRFEFTPSVQTDFDCRFGAVGGAASIDGIASESWMTIDVMN